MNDPFFVGEANDLGDLPHELEAGVDAQTVAVLDQVMIEPDREWIVLKDERGPDFVLGETVRSQNARVAQRFEELILTQGRAFDLPAILETGSGPHQVKAHPSL